MHYKFTILLAGSLLLSLASMSQNQVKQPVSSESSNQPKEEVRSQSSKENSSVRPELPNDFPKFVNTGNPKKDQEDYKIAKQNWIANNPERYKALFQRKEN